MKFAKDSRWLSRRPEVNDELSDQERDALAWREMYKAEHAKAIWHALPFLGELSDAMSDSPAARRMPWLDAACGDGGQLAGIRRGLCWIAVDQSPEALARAQRRLRGGRNSQTVLLRSDTRDLPLINASVGAAMFVDTLSSFIDPLPVLEELARVMAPGAVLALTTFSKADPLMKDMSAPAATARNFIARFYSAGEIEAFADQAGFAVERCYTRLDPELAHPGYRDDDHAHDRVVLIARRGERS